MFIYLHVNFYSYNILISACLRKNKLIEASNWMCALRSSSVTPDPYSRYLEVELYCREGNVPKALETFDGLFKTAIVSGHEINDEINDLIPQVHPLALSFA